MTIRFSLFSRKLWASWSLSAGALAVLACNEVAPPHADPDARPESASAGGTPEAQATFTNVVASGSFCPKGVAAFESSRQDLMTVFLETDAGDNTVSTDCTVVVELEVPEGYQVGAPRAMIRGQARDAELQRTYFIEGGASLQPIRDQVAFPFLLDDAGLSGLSSDTCGGNHRVRFGLELKPLLQNEKAFMSVNSIAFDAAIRANVNWRGCDGASVTEPEGQLGDSCSGARQRTCAAPLRCDNRRGGGVCVDPTEVLPAAGPLENCGGQHDTPCIEGLYCLYESRAVFERKDQGVCGPKDKARHEGCDLPSVAVRTVNGETIVEDRACEAGLRCVRAASGDSAHCQLTTGELGAWCGPGADPCGAGLTCVGSECVVAEAEPEPEPEPEQG